MIKRFTLPFVGALVALIALMLSFLGNPPNMGFCIACFLRDTAGALGLHGAEKVQYLRPEIVGIVLGALLVSLLRREFSAEAGSAPVSRFVLGFAMMVGALIFLGCPLRMLIRLAAGDLNALVGFAGFASGILLGTVVFLKKGFSLRRTAKTTLTDGVMLPLVMVLLLIVFLLAPALLRFSTEGPGSMHAPLLVSLGAGLVVGGIGFASRLCFAGGLRDILFIKKFPPMLGAVVSFLVIGIIGNLILGSFNPGFVDQPIAHTDGVWNFLGMALVGLCASLLGGCPLRQMVLAGSGRSDAVVTAIGMLVGAALAHNFGMVASPDGVPLNGQLGLVVFFAIVVGIAVYNTYFIERPV